VSGDVSKFVGDDEAAYFLLVSFILGSDPVFLLVLGELTFTELGDTLPPSSG